MVFVENYGPEKCDIEFEQVVTCIDATHDSGFGRLVNHSCDPNMTLIPVRIGDIIPQICMFATRNIEAHEELGYNYG